MPFFSPATRCATRQLSDWDWSPIGIVMITYYEKLKDPKWQKIRLKIFNRDKWKCVICENEDQTLHVHHTYYKKNSEPWDYDLDTLKTLCSQCHKFQHETIPNVKEELFITIFKLGYWDSFDLDYIKWFLNEYLPSKKRGEK
jgi:5-methylcytosine-specific restriction endonuclease McrA